MGALKNIGPKLQPKISDPDLTLEELDALVAKYLEDVSVKPGQETKFEGFLSRTE